MNDETRAAVEYLESDAYLAEMLHKSRASRGHMHNGHPRGQIYSFRDENSHPRDRCVCLSYRPKQVTSIPWTKEDERFWLEGHMIVECAPYADMPYTLYMEHYNNWRENDYTNTVITWPNGQDISERPDGTGKSYSVSKSM